MTTNCAKYPQVRHDSGTLRLKIVSTYTRSEKSVFYGKPLPSVLGVAALEHQMGVGKNRLAVGRPYSFSNL